jgi:hypothetical protein
VFSTLCSFFSSNPSSLPFLFVAHPSTTSPHYSSRAHLSRSRLSVAPSLFCGAVGQKRKEKRGKKESNQKGKKESKNKRDRRTVQVGNRNRIVSVKEFCATVFPGL